MSEEVRTTRGMGGGMVSSWEEDGFVWIAVAPHGGNEYAVCLFPDDATKHGADVALAVREASGR